MILENRDLYFTHISKELPNKLYKVAVNPKNIQDISKIRQYIPQEYQGFYDEILNLPTSNEANSDDE